MPFDYPRKGEPKLKAGELVQIATYRDHQGQAVAQKVRSASKEFIFLGDTKSCGLYGMHLWREGGKKLVITEGEIDALSVSQCQDNKWPVVSIPNGAAGAKKSIQKNLEYLEGFEEVIFMFDMDEPGIAAARECALILSPGKAKIATLPLKDPNEMLKAGRSGELINAIWSAKTYRPDGVVAGIDLWEVVSKEDPVPSIPYPWLGLNPKTRGMRKGELITLTAGSGIGKSQVARELAYHLHKHGETIGYVALEESVRRTALGLIALELNRPIHLDRSGTTEQELKAAFDATVGSGRCYLFDHFGSCDSTSLLSRIRYLARGCGCGWVVLDHLSIVVSGIADGDERRLIDGIMTSLRTLVQELGIGMILISHLKRAEGTSHEEGGRVTLAQLRGSQAIAQLSDLVIGLERDPQNLEDSNRTTIRIIKNRWTGEQGEACQLLYDQSTGRLTECSADFSDETTSPNTKDF